jgi:hypothetical protein
VKESSLLLSLIAFPLPSPSCLPSLPLPPTHLIKLAETIVCKLASGQSQPLPCLGIAAETLLAASVVVALGKHPKVRLEFHLSVKI